jgi:hypothetical protein
MGRQASEVLWLTLENEAGEVTRMGVTPTHPLFIAGTGWGDAGALVPGDAIRDKDLQALTVLAVEVDQSPQMVHNLEIADAHTYFAGELEAWGHNGGRPPAEWWRALKGNCKTSSLIRGFLQQQLNRGIPPSRWKLPPGFDQGHFPSNRGKHNMCSRPEISRDNRKRPSITGNNPRWR